MKINGNIIEAEDDKVLTNGTVYGNKVRLGDWDKAENWREILKAEYEAILAQQEEEQQEV